MGKILFFDKIKNKRTKADTSHIGSTCGIVHHSRDYDPMTWKKIYDDDAV